MKKQSIMVVEDERIIARDLQATLQRAGYDVPSLAASGEEAVATATRLKPDLVLMDIVLQGQMDGIMAAAQIRHLGIPVIYLSSYGDQPIVDRAKATEPIGYVLKPYEERDLLTTIQVVLHKFRTSRDRAEAELLASEARFRAIFETSPVGIALINCDGRFVEVNRAFEQATGYEGAALGAMSILDRSHPEDRASEQRMFEELMAGKRDRYQMEKREFTREGKCVWLRISANRFPGGHDANSGRFAVRMAEDITLQKLLHDQLLRAQRMECIGTLSSGIVHNLGNVLVPVGAGIGMLHGMVTDEAALNLISTMEQSVHRATGIIRQLLSFGRGDDGQMVKLAPDVLLDEVGRFVRDLFAKTIQITLVVDPAIRAIHGDSNELHQALLNLCTNSRDAMGDSGKLWISARNVMVSPEKAKMYPEVTAGLFVAISVRDNGPGMSSDVAERIFDPFFTTKPAGKGTGLGLSTTLGIIKRHKGFIEVDSEPGKGTEIRLLIPAATRG
jgi:PAS domain S-box-containing protein